MPLVGLQMLPVVKVEVPESGSEPYKSAER